MTRILVIALLTPVVFAMGLCGVVAFLIYGTLCLLEGLTQKYIDTSPDTDSP